MNSSRPHWNPASPLRIGTRASPLAQWQTQWVERLLKEQCPGLRVEVVPIRTRGEAFPDRPLEGIGVGVFTRELDEALTRGDVDAAVHSLKDIPSVVAEGVCLAAIPQRESPLDCWVSANGAPIESLPAGAKVGTGSPRRKAQLLAFRPDLRIVPLRGNVDTRLAKIRQENLAGTILAHAGLRRLGREDVVTQRLEPELMVPAVGQGAVAVCARELDTEALSLLAAIDHPTSRRRVLIERAFLKRLRGGCQVPAGALAELECGELKVKAVLAAPDGSTCLRESVTLPLNGETPGQELGDEIARRLLARGGEELLARVRMS